MKRRYKYIIIIVALLLAVPTLLYYLLGITGYWDKLNLCHYVLPSARALANERLHFYFRENNGAFPGSRAQWLAQGREYGYRKLKFELILLYGATVNDIEKVDDTLVDKVTRKSLLLIDGPDMGHPELANEYYNQLSNEIFEQFSHSEYKELNRGISKHTHPHTKLHEAAEQGDLSQVQLLLAKGADVNAADTGLFTPLHGAVTYGYEDVVRVLIEHGADVNARDTGGYTPLHVAAVRGYTKIAEILIQHGAEIGARNNNSNTPLEEAKKFGNEQVAEILRKHGEVGK